MEVDEEWERAWERELLIMSEHRSGDENGDTSAGLERDPHLKQQYFSTSLRDQVANESRDYGRTERFPLKDTEADVYAESQVGATRYLYSDADDGPGFLLSQLLPACTNSSPHL